MVDIYCINLRYAERLGVRIMAKKLLKSKNDIMLDGVCAGLAEYFNIDPTIVRVIFVIISVSGGAGLLAYIILALVMPRAGSERDPESSHRTSEGKRRPRDTQSFEESFDEDYNEANRNTNQSDDSDEESWRDF